MAALGDVSKVSDTDTVWFSLGVSIPAWPDVSQAIPADSDPVPPASGFPGYFSFA